jgi:hypothetical protein
METNHRIDWEGATCMEFNGFEDERMFLESWFTKCDENSINICRFAAICQEYTLG